jgi:A/G-specific adenine glycosylase
VGSSSTPLVPFAGRRRQALQAALLEWYRAGARPLRIRSTRQPWPVLVAEVMAQQTQVARVDEAWVAFLARFPTPQALADASPAEALRAWSGLGYNRRAVNLQRAARDIVAAHGGVVPTLVEELEALPGVGPYTARAVAAIAHGDRVAAVDTNVRRVLCRLLGRPLAAQQLQAVADGLVPAADPATWTHASMELGATVCRAARPRCDVCPVRRWCASADGLGLPGATDPARPGGSAGSKARARRPSHAAHGPTDRPAFERTTRWLRGRIVAHLRQADEGAWVDLPDRIGSHGPQQVAAAAHALRRDGLLESRADGAVRLPSTSP